MSRKVAAWLIGAGVPVIAAAVYFGVMWTMVPLATQSGPSAHPAMATIDIPEGTTFRQVAELLEKERLIRNKWAFLLLGRLTWTERRILAGEYALHAGMSPVEILSEFREGHVVLHPVTIPEGYTVARIAELLGEKGLADPEEFMRLAHDRDFIRSLNLDASNLEGYLFPNTYYIARHTGTKTLITQFVEGLRHALTPEVLARAQIINMSIHEVLTLASVIEKETSVPEERGVISAVFHNRLRRGIRLQSDPTVIYGLASFDGNLRKRDLQSSSPYNTYRFGGLPPGPIANPGAGAISAAVYPAMTSYLYFVSRNDGTHHFSSTLVEHNHAVNKYQRRPAQRRS